MAHSFNIRIANPNVHGYAQQYCFLNGPDARLNQELRREVQAATVPLSEERDAQRMRFMTVEEQAQAERELRDSLRIPSEFGLDQVTVAAWCKDMAWKMALIPKSARSVLVLGSATCREAIFIRARLPAARIVCADFVDERLPNVETALGIEFRLGDFHELLEQARGSFDVVFSNHVLEHLFDPGRTFKLIRGALTAQGVLVSALPLDGQPEAPFSQVLNTRPLHALDMCAVDVAHAWKTNVSELQRALVDAGFAEARFSGRDRYFSCAGKPFSSRAAFQRRARRGLLLNRALFGSLRGALKRLLPADPPRLVTRAVFGLEHRVWFGSNRLKNAFSIECLFVAQ